MAVNNMSFTDLALILNDIHQQATGRKSIAPVNTGEFVSMAQATLGTGVDNVYNALMDVTMKPIFAVRDYTEKFKALYRTNEEFGAIKRKISFVDKPINDDSTKTWVPAGMDGQSMDQWIINQDEVLEMRFYGRDGYKDHFTVYEEQLKTAFSSPDQLGSFLAAQVTHRNNIYKQYRENLTRSTVANFIGAKYLLAGMNNDNLHVIHLLTEYNNLTGLTLTPQTIYQPDNVEPFFKWVRARINTIARMMSERSDLFQYHVADKPVTRHTTNEFLNIYLDASALDIVDTMVNANTYHDEPLKYANSVEGVSFWQNIRDPKQITVKPAYNSPVGNVVIPQSDVSVSAIFGLMCDVDAMAVNQYFYAVRNTPVNSSGLYFNTWLHANFQYTNDLTEKGTVLLLD